MESLKKYLHGFNNVDSFTILIIKNTNFKAYINYRTANAYVKTIVATIQLISTIFNSCLLHCIVASAIIMPKLLSKLDFIINGYLLTCFLVCLVGKSFAIDFKPFF